MIGLFRRFSRFLHNRMRFSNFFTKLVALFLLAAFLPLMLCSFLFINEAMNSAAETTAAAIRTNLYQSYSVMDSHFSQLKKYANLLLGDSGINDFLRNGDRDATFSEQLTFKKDLDNTITFIENAQNIQQLRIYANPSYFYILDSRHIFSMEGIEEIDWMQDLLMPRGRSVWVTAEQNDVLYSAKSIRYGGPTISYMVKGVDLNDMTRTAVIYQLDFPRAFLEEQLSSTLVLDESCSFVIDKKGSVIASAFRGDIPVTQEQLASCQDGDAILIDGESYVVDRASFTNAPWDMVALVSVDSLTSYSDLDQVIFFVLLAFFVGTIVFSTSLRFSQNVTRKIRSVVRGMEQVRSGVFENIPTESTHDEIDELIDHYNYMTDELELLVEAKYLSGVELKAAQLRALQAQINPHFLYNTLEMINSYAFLEDPGKVEQLVQALSNFYRLSLNHGKDIYQLWQELKLVEAYFEIQKIRYPDCLSLKIDVPSSMMQYAVPNITLQPLIENSIRHGILLKEDKKGTITILGRVLEDTIELQVIDDGIGMPQEVVDRLNAGLPMEESYETTGSGYGIHNINERIQNYYGKAYRVHFSSVPGQGTVVTITLPPM